MPVPLHSVAIGQVAQPRPVYDPLPQQENRVENEQVEQRTEALRRTELVKPRFPADKTDNRAPVSLVRNSVELDRLLSGEKGILVDTLM